MMRQRGTSLTLKTHDDDFECTVLLLWNKNTKNNALQDDGDASDQDGERRN